MLELHSLFQIPTIQQDIAACDVNIAKYFQGVKEFAIITENKVLFLDIDAKNEIVVTQTFEDEDVSYYIANI
jgi:hypothetical protein